MSVTCSATGWFPFQDPSPESVQQLVRSMLERIELEQWHRDLNPTEYEKSENHLRRFLRKHFLDLEIALNQWHGWVQWRRYNHVEEISDEDVKHELKEGIFSWRGKNKQNMLCCVITGRMLHPNTRVGTPSSFKKYLIKFVEEGLRQADLTDQDKICIIYDRRELDFHHIDPNLYQFCQKVMMEMRDWYGDRIGFIYVLHTNFFFWALYYMIVKPFLTLWNGSNQLIVVEDPGELLDYFDEDQLFLLSCSSIDENNDEKESTEADGVSTLTYNRLEEVDSQSTLHHVSENIVSHQPLSS